MVGQLAGSFGDYDVSEHGERHEHVTSRTSSVCLVFTEPLLVVYMELLRNSKFEM